MIKEAIYGVMNGEDLSFEMAKTVMDEIMEGRATNAQIGSFLTAMRMKGESIEEITACATVMRNHCTKLRPAADVLDIVGTGGDEAYTFNISTVSALVIAAAGVPVAKHGNRSVSSKCGSADLLEALGVKIGLSAAQSEQVLARTGICFMFAPTFHASMKYAAPVRKELGARTIFNILGPLANPAGATLQLLGVYDESLVEPLARVLANLGVKRAMVVHGHDGLDEVTLCSSSIPRSLGLKNAGPRTWWAATRGKTRKSRWIFCAGRPGRSATSCCSTRRSASIWPITTVRCANVSGWRPRQLIRAKPCKNSRSLCGFQTRWKHDSGYNRGRREKTCGALQTGAAGRCTA